MNNEKINIDVKDEDLKAAEFLKNAREKLIKEIRKAIIGQGEVIDELLITLFSRGH